MNYLQEHDDDPRRRLVSLAHFDTTTENDELVTLLKLNFIEYPAKQNQLQLIKLHHLKLERFKSI